MAKEKRFIISYVLLIVVIIVATLIWQAQQVEQEIQEIKKPVEVKVKEDEEKPMIPKQLTPANPEDYGMIVIDEFDKPTTQAEWNELIQQNLNSLKENTSEQTITKIRKEIKQNLRRSKEKTAWIDATIAKCKKILEIEPANEKIKAKLERLMILKALGERLEEF